MIEVEHLRKSYGDVAALDGVSFRIAKGEIVGFLGPNGAGKTTCMKILTGYMAATSGTVRVGGMDVHADSLKTRAIIGYLPENSPIYADMRVYDYLAYVAELRQIPVDRRRDRMGEVVRVCGLTDVLAKPVSALSKGYRQRVGLAQALIHDPAVLILDEPTAGLDPNQIVEIRELIRSLGKERTIILSTHNLPEVLQTCDRMLIIHRGKLVADGSAADLEQREAQNPPVIVRFDPSGKTVDEAQSALKSVEGVVEAEHRGTVDRTVEFVLKGKPGVDLRPTVGRAVAEHGFVLYELRRDALDLEGIFRRLTRQA